MTVADDRIGQAMAEAKVAHDVRVLGDFQAIYCRGNHGEAARRPVETRGAHLGVYGRRVPKLCAECESFLAYAEERRALCPRDPKPACKNCPTHCYRPERRETAREVMRYAGPRSVFSRYALDAIAHALDGRRTR